jgi:hypothetical protein
VSFWSRAATILGAFLAACLVAAIVLSLTICLRVAMASSAAGFDTEQFFGLLKGLPLMTAYSVLPIVGLTLLPASIAMGLTEAYRIRSFSIYLAAGAVVAFACLLVLRFGLSFMVMPANSKFVRPPPSTIPTFSASWNYLLAGLIAGATYWTIAGRKAGMVREQR